jgi:hypothetical protein
VFFEDVVDKLLIVSFKAEAGGKLLDEKLTRSITLDFPDPVSPMSTILYSSTGGSVTAVT